MNIQATSIPTSSSSSAMWVSWHKTLKKKFGKKKANIIWIAAWDKRAGTGSSASTVELRDYMDSQGVKIDTTTLEDITDVGGDITDFFGGAFNILKYGALIGGGATVAILLFALFNIAKHPAESVGTAAKTYTDVQTAGLATKTPMK